MIGELLDDMDSGKSVEFDDQFAIIDEYQWIVPVLMLLYIMMVIALCGGVRITKRSNKPRKPMRFFF
jgi:hypothetical protein